VKYGAGMTFKEASNPRICVVSSEVSRLVAMMINLRAFALYSCLARVNRDHRF